MLDGRGSMLVLILCTLKEASASGRCVQGLCCFQDPMDSHTAGGFCEARNLKLLESKELEAVARLLKGLSGKFWVGPTESRSNCPAVFVMPGQNITALSVPCQDKLDGLVCQYKHEDGCKPLDAGGEQVTYVTHKGDELLDSEAFPPGTFATVGNKQAKHLCSSSWSEAPWSCEVLNGGCEHKCSKPKTCMCPQGYTLLANKFSCVQEGSVACAHSGQKQGVGHVCPCNAGYRLGADGKSCVDVDECKEKPNVCAGTGKVCVNQKGEYKCECMTDFVEEEGVCVNTSICFHCEHKCEKISGVYRCVCEKGFQVSPTDPTKCMHRCGRRQCAATCVRTENQQQCFCPEGYISDMEDQNALCYDIDECAHQSLCEHVCLNTYGSYVCMCKHGYQLEGSRCVRMFDGDDEEHGSGFAEEVVTPAVLARVTLPPYVKAGSVMGISVFLVLGAGLLWFLLRKLKNRCGTLNLTTLKHTDIDIFHLQQVTMSTTETYKRLSFDKQSKNEPPR